MFCKSLNGLLLPPFRDLFYIDYDIHDHHTRHKSGVHVIAPGIRERAMCIRVTSPDYRRLEIISTF